MTLIKEYVFTTPHITTENSKIVQEIGNGIVRYSYYKTNGQSVHVTPLSEEQFTKLLTHLRLVYEEYQLYDNGNYVIYMIEHVDPNKTIEHVFIDGRNIIDQHVKEKWINTLTELAANEIRATM